MGAFQIRDVHRSVVGIHIRRILSRLEIVIHVQISVAVRRFVLQRMNVAEMTDLHVLFAGRAVTLAALVSLFSRDRTVPRPANLSTPADGLLLLSASLLVVYVAYILRKCVAICAGDSTP
jgi:hypothetical protein